MDITTAENLARKLINQHVKQRGWSIKFNRSKTVLGMVNPSNKTLYLSKPATEASTYEQVLDTILHEIAHINTLGDGHGPAWRREARRLGAKPQAAAVEGKDAPNMRKNAPWVGICPFGHEAPWRFFTKPRAVRSCPTCNPGRYDERFRLDYIFEPVLDW